MIWNASVSLQNMTCIFKLDSSLWPKQGVSIANFFVACANERLVGNTEASAVNFCVKNTAFLHRQHCTNTYSHLWFNFSPYNFHTETLSCSCLKRKLPEILALLHLSICRVSVAPNKNVKSWWSPLHMSMEQRSALLHKPTNEKSDSFLSLVPNCAEIDNGICGNLTCRFSM